MSAINATNNSWKSCVSIKYKFFGPFVFAYDPVPKKYNATSTYDE